MTKHNFRLGLFVTSPEKDYNKSRASFWIRIYQMIEYYESLGVEVCLNNYFKRYDAAIIFRKTNAKYLFILRYLKLISKKAYFDTCINIFERNEEITEKKLRYAFKIAQVADGIICASNQIAKFSAPYSKTTFVMEDPINIDHFKTVKTDINFENPIFGWSGVGLKSIFLNALANDIDGRIHIISDEGLKDVQLKFKYKYTPWTYKNFPSDLLKCDIAILPRNTDDNYNSGHSSFKALVYGISGIPIISNKIPSYMDLSNYYDGIVFLEDNDNSVEKCIIELSKRSLNTSRLREHYSCQHQASMLIKYLTSQLTLG